MSEKLIDSILNPQDYKIELLIDEEKKKAPEQRHHGGSDFYLIYYLPKKKKITSIETNIVLFGRIYHNS